MAHHNAHAARIDDDGIVREVIVIPRQDDDRDDLVQQYCNAIGLPGIWRDCSYLGSRRKFYPGVDFRYDEERDEYVPPGFVLVDGEWVAPAEEPAP